MEVSVKNFRCWEKKTITLSIEGVTLLSGPSGTGKSSLLEAIHFAITGSGRNIISQGKKNCEVRVILNDGVSILRKKRPNIVKVSIPGKGSYEDDAAEGYLSQRFTKMFSNLGYIGQNGKNTSFVLKGPSEKLQFLESLAFRNIDISSIKLAIYKLYKQDEKNITSITAKLEVIHDQLSNEVEPPKNIPFPTRTKDKRGFEVKTKTKFQKLRKIIPKIEAKISRLQETYNQCSSKQSMLENLEEGRLKLQDDGGDIEDELADYAQDLDERKDETHKNLMLHRKYKEKSRLEKKYSDDLVELERLKVLETRVLEKDIADIKAILWNLGDKAHTKNLIKSLKTGIELSNQLESISKEMEKLKADDIDIDALDAKIKNLSDEIALLTDLIQKVKLSKELYRCPGCNANVRLVSGKLVKSCHTGPVDDNRSLEELESMLKKNSRSKGRSQKRLLQCENAAERLESLVIKRNKLSEEFEDLQIDTEKIEQKLEDSRAYLVKHRHLEKKLTDLKCRLSNNVYSQSIEELEKSLDKIRRKLEKLDTKGVLIGDENELEVKLIELSTAISSRDAKLAMLEQVRGSIEINSRKIKDIHDYLVSSKHDQLLCILQHEKKQLERAREKEDGYSTIMSKMENYFSREKDIVHYKKIKKNLKEHSVLEKSYKGAFSGSARLRELIKEAESQCLSIFVDSIEAEVQLYLDELFVEHPITLHIKRYKKTKTKKIIKPEIHILFDYKGRECDYTSLSGGESQRIVLAFTLAFAERFALPLILLDECTSNLDQALTGRVVEIIKQYQHNRPVLLVAHQVVSGIFDKVISL